LQKLQAKLSSRIQEGKHISHPAPPLEVQQLNFGHTGNNPWSFGSQAQTHPHHVLQEGFLRIVVE
jgi:hypothetical protein